METPDLYRSYFERPHEVSFYLNFIEPRLYENITLYFEGMPTHEQIKDSLITQFEWENENKRDLIRILKCVPIEIQTQS